MVNVIEKLGMQATVKQKGDYNRGLFRTMIDNWQTYRAIKTSRSEPLFSDPKPRLHASDVVYNLEYSRGLEVTFINEKTFRVIGRKKKVLGKGRLGQPFAWSGGTFTLKKGSGASPKAKDEFTLGLKPVTVAAEALAKSLKIKPDEENPKTLLHLSYAHPNRHHSANVLNTIMDEVHTLLQEETRSASQAQLNYLNQRQQERLVELKERMEIHADLCASDLTTTGFMDSQQQLAFLSTNNKQIKQRLMQLEMERKRLENLQGLDECALYDHWGTTADSEIINQSLVKMRTLRQQRDSLDLALRKNERIDEEMVEQLFTRQMEDLDRLKEYSTNARTILASLDDDDILPNSNQLLEASDTLAPLWFRRLQQSYDIWKEAHAGEKHKKQQEWLKEKQGFSSYIKNISRVLEVQEKILEERLAHQRNPSDNFHGIDLPTAQQLYLHYTKNLDDTEVQLQQQVFLLNQIKNPEFDLTALSTVANDGISQGIVNQVGQLRLKLQDKANRSEKELERLRSEIQLQREFLTSHVEQSLELLHLRKELILDKVEALQNVSLDLLHQQISMEEKNLSDYLVTRMDNIDQEKSVQNRHLRELEQQMAELPKRWVSEQLYKEEVDANQRVVRQVAQLVESKILQKNLEIIQSTPLDRAIVPTIPSGPRIKLFVVAGAFAGILFSLSAVLLSGLRKGVPTSPETLRHHGHHVSGSLSNGMTPKEILRDDDLETLRRVITHCYPERDRTSSCHRLLLIEGKGPHYAPQIATLLSKRGLKVLLLPLTFDGSDGDSDNKEGILQVINGSTNTATIIEEAEYDRLPSGGVTRFAGEIATSPIFLQLLDTLNKEFDCIVAYSKEPASSAEAETFLSFANAVAVTLKEESLEQLASFWNCSIPATFLFSNDC